MTNLDYLALFDEDLIPIDSLFPEDWELQQLPQCLFDIWDNFIWLPDSEIQKVPIVSYALLPSLFCKNLPILALIGNSGTGKSEHSKLIGKLRNIEPEMSASSYAGLRNSILEKRFPDFDEDMKEALERSEYEAMRFSRRNEQLMLLIFEDIGLEKFSDERFYSLLKSGISRDTDKISLSMGNGKNLTFYTFCPKILSTIHPIYGEGVLPTNELQRRLIIGKHIKGSIANLESLSDYSFDGIEMTINRYWRNISRVTDWKKWNKSLKAKDFPDIKPEIFLLWKDLINCSLTVGFCADKKQAIETWTTYYLWLQDLIDCYKDTFLELLKGHLEGSGNQYESLQDYLLSLSKDEINSAQKKIQTLSQLGVSDDEILQVLVGKDSISASDLSLQIDKWYARKLIARKTDTQIRSAMNSLGYQLDVQRQTYYKQGDN